MSAPFKFKLKVKTGGGPDPAPLGAPVPPPAPYGGHDTNYAAAPAGSQQWKPPQAPSAPPHPAPSSKFKLKVKVGGGGGGGAAAPPYQQPPYQPPYQQPQPPYQQPQPPYQQQQQQQPKQEQQPAWDPSSFFSDTAPPAQQQQQPSVKREAPADGWGSPAAAPVIKKIKLSTGRPAGIPPAAPGLPLKKPIIKFKPPAKQPRDAAAAAVVGAAAAADPLGQAPAPAPALPRASTLPIVRLTVVPGGGQKRTKPKGAKARGAPAAAGGGGGGKKGKAKPGKQAGAAYYDDMGGAAPKRPKRSRQEIKELRDLGADVDDEDDDDYDGPVAPRTLTLRSQHAAAAAAAAATPSFAGVDFLGAGLSAGGPAPSDAYTGMSGGAAGADTAGTEAREERPPPMHRQQMGPGPIPKGPIGPPKRDDMEKLLARCQKKDLHHMFKEPVTEAIAPGYFEVIKQPMDFGTMKTKAAKGQYAGWEGLRADMRLMFTNALTYNAEGGNVYNYAKLLMGQCDRIVELAMQGKTDFRSSATITRKHNAQVKAQQRAEREQLRAQARAEQRAAQEAKVLKKAGLASSYDEHEDENIRNSYRRAVRDPNVARWRGLGSGANAEGVSWGAGRQVLRPVNPWLPPGMYALSLARFAANLSGRARELVMQRARASTAADEAAERLLQQQLAKKVPLPPAQPPAPAVSVGTAAAAAAAAAGRHAGFGQQQQTAMQAALGAASAAAGSAASMAAAPGAMMMQQQLMMQAAAGGRLGGMLGGGGMLGTRPAGPPSLPVGATITFMPTPQGMVPFLIQPGQPPIMMMAPGGLAGMGQKPGGGMLGMPGTAGAAGAAGLPPGMQSMLQQPFQQPLQPGLMQGMHMPRPAQ